MSLTKSQIKLIRSLQVKKYRESEGLFVVEGPKMIHELLNQERYKVDRIFCIEDFLPEIKSDVDVTTISNKELQQISGLKSPNQVLATVHINSEPIQKDSGDVVLMLEDISDPGNFGTIIRTASWFGIDEIITTENSVDLFNPKVLQATMGAVFHVDVHSGNTESKLSELKESGYKFLGTFMDGESVFELEKPSKTLLIMGSESHGISPEFEKLLDQKITIPRIGRGESLNLAVAAGICISALKR